MTDSALRLAVLGSGSGGNATAVRLLGDAPRTLLIDLGLSPRQIRRRLKAVGLAFGAVTDVLLTHLDSDHFSRSWVKPLHAHPELTVRVHRRHVGALRATGVPEARIAAFDDEPIPLVPPATGSTGSDRPAGDSATWLTPVHLPHDRLGTTGFLLEHRGARLGFATDLGRVPPSLLETFGALDALALESNYDPDLQARSPRPPFLKARITGGQGHLSNEQCLDAAVRLDRRRPLQHLALLHLSRQCNCPLLVRRLYERRARGLAERLLIARQDAPTPLITVRAGSTPGVATPPHRPRARWTQGQLFEGLEERGPSSRP